VTNILLKRTSRERICNSATALSRNPGKKGATSPFALLALTLYLAGIAHSAFGQTCPQPAAAPATDPTRNIVAVHLNASTGDITVGSTTYCGQNPGFHLLALQRQPDTKNPATPIILLNQSYTDSASANSALQQLLSTYTDPLIMVNAVGSYGVALASVASGLTPFGAYSQELQGTGSIPFIFIGSGGRNPNTALQRGNGVRDLDGYLAQDVNFNYTFMQTDYVHYDLTPDGTIKVGSKTYTVPNAAYKNCPAGAALSDSFHLLVVDRESPDTVLADNVYCTGQHPEILGFMATDLSGVNSEGALVFIDTNGHPIPPDWNFGTDGDGRVYPLAHQIARFGGYFETMVYLTPNDSYSLVGAVAPPSYVTAPRDRARESSSVYPADVNGKEPTGELHGVLSRGRGAWYSPLNADTVGSQNLGLYDILAETPIPFPHPVGVNEVSAYQYINQNICDPTDQGLACGGYNVRNQYDNQTFAPGNAYSTLLNLTDKRDPNNVVDCDIPANANLPFCIVRRQVLTELNEVTFIHNFQGNMTDLWLANGVVVIGESLSAFDDVKATLPQASPTAQTSPLVAPLVNFFLSLAGNIPFIGPAAGLASVGFNLGIALTTDTKGNKQVDLTSTIGQLHQQTIDQFKAQGSTLGTMFQFLYQDWGKIDALGSALITVQDSTSPWYWKSDTTAQMVNEYQPAVKEAAYQSIMPAAYAIGSYVPQSALNCFGFGTAGYPPGQNPVWGQTPLYAQPRGFVIFDSDYVCGNLGNSAYVIPFAPPSAAVYIPYTYPNDPTNPYASDAHTGTILADGSWLGISLQTSPKSSGANNHYDPPDLTLLSTLFTPVSQSGLGVYRPDFFEGWPFPRVTCTGADFHGNPGGCDWGSGVLSTPPPPPAPAPGITIRATEIGRAGTHTDVLLNVFNSGTVQVNSIEINSIALRTEAGSGQATMVSPSLPVRMQGLAPGDSNNVIVTLDIPTGITKLEVVEQGSAHFGQAQPVGTPGTPFSYGQLLYPQP
jgi:hypothetical protein